MKVNIYDDNLLIVFLMKEKYPIKDNISTIIKRILTSLKVQYGISLNGYYNIDIYIDKYYGMVIEIMNQNDFLPIYTDEIEINVNLNKKNYFLYEIDDILLIPRDLINKIKLYNIDNKNYFKITKDLSSLEIGYLLEISKLVYNPLILNKNFKKQKKPSLKILNNVIFK